MTAGSVTLLRLCLAFVFLAVLALTFRNTSILLQAADARETDHFQEVLKFARGLAENSDGTLGDNEVRQLQNSVLRLELSLNYWTRSANADGQIATQARKDC